MVVEGVEVHGHTIGSAYLVLPAIAPSDALGIVVLGVEARAQEVVDAVSGGGETFVAAQGQYGHSHRGQPTVQVGDDADSVAVGLLIVGVQPEGQRGPVDATGWLDDVGIIPSLRVVVEVAEVLAAELCVLPEVEVGAVGDALELGPAPGKSVFDVVAVLRVVGQFVGAMAAEPEVLRANAEVDVPAEAILYPAVQPLQVGLRAPPSARTPGSGR